MGKKVNPKVIRIGITRNWESQWFASHQKYTDNILQDILLRQKIKKMFPNSGISSVGIERSTHKTIINIFTSRPGVLIGKQGTSIQELKTNLEKEFKEQFDINIKEIKKPYLDAYIVAELIGQQISKRMPFRRAIKSTMEKVTEAGAQGVKVFVTGRLNGVEIARSEYFLDGKIPLHTLRSDIDYAQFGALTTYGIIGIKVWIYKGEKFAQKRKKNNEKVIKD